MHVPIVATTWKAEAGESLNTGVPGQQNRVRLGRIGKQKHRTTITTTRKQSKQRENSPYMSVRN